MIYNIVLATMMLLTPHTVEFIPSYVCQVNNIGLTQATSLALGQGSNVDSFIEGSLVVDFGIDRETAETTVNALHQLLVGDKIVNPTFADFGDC